MLYPEFDPVIVQFGPLAIRWYGMMYLVGFSAAWLLGRIHARRADTVIAPRQVDDLLFYCAIGAVAGGRLGYILFYNFEHWLADPFIFLRIWEGGMSFHGGLLGVAIALMLFSRHNRLSIWGVGDFIAPLAPLGLFAGRIGNFINGELWGAPTSLPWGMQVACANRYDLCVNKLQLSASALYTPPLHPTQLYEALFEGLILFALLWLYTRKPRVAPAVTGWFLIGYGVFRFLVEFMRMPDSHLGYLAFDWLTLGQTLSLPMILLGVGMLAYARWFVRRM